MVDENNISRYYHLQEAEIPIQKINNSKNLLNFIELLLNLRVNIY